MEEYSRDLGSIDSVSSIEELSDKNSLLEWARRVFADPLSFSHRISEDLFTVDHASPEYEAALYLDWQARDTELGYRFLLARRESLLRSIEDFRRSISSRESARESARMRMEALRMIGPAGCNSPEGDTIFIQLDAEMRTAKEELRQLRRHIGSIDLLKRVLEPIAGGASDEEYNLAEQRMYLIGQSWRGWMRMRACNHNYPSDQQNSSTIDSNHPVEKRILIHHTSETTNPLGTDLLIEQEAARYLRHFLLAIATLSNETARFFQTGDRPKPDPSSWPAPMSMLRAIVEFFYFCSFELPLLSNSLMVLSDDSSEIRRFDEERGELLPVTDERLNNRLKRESASIVHLVLSNFSLSNLQRFDDLSALDQDCSLEPYRTTGLARLNINPSTQVYKFQSAYRMTSRVIERIVDTDPILSDLFQSSLGGAIETIAGMAALDSRAFKAAGALEPMPSTERFRWLSRFWSTMGKWRPIALLGDNYTREISAGLQSLGESTPERSSMISIQLPSLSRVLPGKNIGVREDPANELILADQIRLSELLNGTWILVDEIALRIGRIDEYNSLEALLASLPEAAERQEIEIGRRFNSKWQENEKPILSLLRGCSPAIWNFWSKVADREPCISYLTNLAPDDALNGLLHLCAGSIRMITLMESISPLTAERLEANAETSARVLLTAFQRCIGSSKLGKHSASALSETIRYYYDFEAPYDAWLAFTKSLKAYLQQLQNDLAQFNPNSPEIEIFATSITKIELHCPASSEKRVPASRTETVVREETDQAEEEEVATASSLIDEGDALSIELLCSRLFGRDAIDEFLLLKLLASFRISHLRPSIHLFSSIERSLREWIPDNSLRRGFFSTPKAIRDTAQFLSGFRSEEGGDIYLLPEDARAQLQDYLMKLYGFQKYVESLLGVSPFFRTEDRQELVSLDEGKSIDLILFSVFDQTFCTIARKRPDRSIAEFQAFLHEKAANKFLNWEAEYLILGTAGLRVRKEGIAITGAEDSLDPLFTEPEKRSSWRLLIASLRGKYQLLSEILKRELPDRRFLAQPGI
jgi:hypothetical protein